MFLMSAYAGTTRKVAARCRLDAYACPRGAGGRHTLRQMQPQSFYKPLELREVIGNVTIDEVREKVRCQKCGSREWMDAELFHPTGEQAHTIRFRRLKEIRWEKRVIWQDE